jgi:hypothetical protein
MDPFDSLRSSQVFRRAFWQRLDCWCCLNAHWFLLTSIAQCSQIIEGTSLTQFAGRSPTNSCRVGYILRAFW